MKKRKPFFVLHAICFVAIAITATTPQAQAATVTLYTSPGTVTWNTASVFADVNTGGPSTFKMYIKYQPAGDTVSTTPEVLYSTPWPQVDLTGLPNNKTIAAYAVVIVGTDTVSSNTVTFTTLPFPHKPYISNVVVKAGPLNATVNFNYQVAEVPTRFVCIYGVTNFMYTSDTFTVTTIGSGAGYVTVSNPYVQGTTYNIAVLKGQSVNNIVPDSVWNIGAFTVPGFSQPDVSNVMTFSSVSQDSFKFSVSISKGNAATAVVVIRDLDSVGTVVNTQPAFTISHDTVITSTRYAPPFTMCGERVIVYTNGGSDSTTAYERTLQVPAPDVISIDTANAGTTTTDLQVVVKTNGKATWASSAATVTVKYVTAANTVVTLPEQTIVGSPNAATLTFTGLSNLKLNPTSNVATVIIRNDAGLVDSLTYSFKLRGLLPSVHIDNSFYIEAINAYEIRIKNINAGPSTDPYKIAYLINVLGSGSVDTSIKRVNQIGVTDFLKWDTIGNLIGNTTYQIRAATINADNVWNITTFTATITTIPAANPSFFISNSISTTATSVSYRFMGNCNGTPSYARVQVLLKGTMQVVQQFDHGYLGTGNFDQTGTIGGLSVCTEYWIRVLIHNGQLGNQMTDEKEFKTDCTTGVNDATLIKLQMFPNPTTDFLNIVAPREIGECQLFGIDGQLVATYDFTQQTEARIFCADIPKGVYVLKGIGFTERFVRQ